MSVAALLRRNRHRKKLRNLLSKADNEAFLQLIWSVDALQSERAAVASKHLLYPPGAATADIDAKLAIRKWELETLVGELLISPKAKPSEGKNRILDCSKFDSIVALVSRLRDLEDAESALRLERRSVLKEMRRIGLRQFPWQRGYFNAPQLSLCVYLWARGVRRLF